MTKEQEDTKLINKLERELANARYECNERSEGREEALQKIKKLKHELTTAKMTNEQQAAYVNSQVACAMIEAMGMVAENEQRTITNNSPAYVKDDFDRLITQYGIHREELEEHVLRLQYVENGHRNQVVALLEDGEKQTEKIRKLERELDNVTSPLEERNEDARELLQEVEKLQRERDEARLEAHSQATDAAMYHRAISRIEEILRETLK